MNRRLSLLFLLVLVLWPLSAAAQVPSDMSYQGQLLDPMGGHVTGNVFIQVRVYASETPAEGEAPLYIEDHDGVLVEGGVFNLLVGQGVPLAGTFSGPGCSTRPSATSRSV